MVLEFNIFDIWWSCFLCVLQLHLLTLMLKFHLNDCILFAVSCTSIENFSVMLDNIANCSDAKFIVKQTRLVQC